LSLSLSDARVGARAYRFGDFELDVEALRLTRLGEPVRLERRPFDLLLLLVARRGQLVRRDELVAALWPDNVIIDFDAGLNTLVRKVRQALGDHSEAPTYIETVPGRGYRFVARVVEITRLERPAPPAPPPAAPIAIAGRRRLLPILGLGTLLLLATIAVGWTLLGRAPTSITVLPFENLSGNAELGYLASGLAEETSASLTQIDPDNLRVIGGISLRALATGAPSAAEIGRRLGVEYVVRSALQADGTRIRVNATLIRVAGNEQVWSKTLDRELDSLLELQRELSIAIAEQVRLTLSPDVAAAINRRQTRNPEAYRLYLQGRYAWGRLTPVGNRDALAFYRRAVEKDPDYALAWAGIAQALAVSQMTVDADPQRIADEARNAVAHAVQADPELAEVSYARGYVSFFLDWDPVSAEAAARRAVALDPNNAFAHMFLGVVLTQLGNHVESRDVMRRARELDPLFAHAFVLSSMVATQAGDYATGRTLARQAVAMYPDGWPGYLHLGNAEQGLGNDAAALAAFEAAARLSGGNSQAIAARGYLLARLGRTGEAHDLLDQLEKTASDTYVPGYAFAAIYAGLGDTDAAFEWLERDFERHDAHLLGLKYDLQLLPLATDPRYRDLLIRSGQASR